MFYEYGKLDRLLEQDITTFGVTICMRSIMNCSDRRLRIMHRSTNSMKNMNTDHWYFSFRSMMQYYRLIREYGSLHSMKLSENPYVKKAEEMLSAALYSCCLNGGMGWSYQKKIGAEWSSGLIVETDGSFHYEIDLLEALLAIDAWYTEEVQKLENLLRKERTLAKRVCSGIGGGMNKDELRIRIIPEDGQILIETHTDGIVEMQSGAGRCVSGLH